MDFIPMSLVLFDKQKKQGIKEQKKNRKEEKASNHIEYSE
jgi:hypothetical protein